jgi:hypothetical protein
VPAMKVHRTKCYDWIIAIQGKGHIIVSNIAVVGPEFFGSALACEPDDTGTPGVPARHARLCPC